MKEELIDILICPQSKQPVIYVERSQELWCKASRLAYPIRDEIPILLVGESRQLSLSEIQSIP
ncbi:MAG: tetraacyldisaccharide 4'-kinase [Gammaproteobacteria bacterium]|jgi:hypothetical protein|nr:tetraacyldisaccharide 4'-kinase [Gammaproteobacteria bacterium]|tara:strand:- start:369 stop:557 length:189 start_codon:yes stop_codon:yes gene_type:complete